MLGESEAKIPSLFNTRNRGAGVSWHLQSRGTVIKTFRQNSEPLSRPKAEVQKISYETLTFLKIRRFRNNWKVHVPSCPRPRRIYRGALLPNDSPWLHVEVL